MQNPEIFVFMVADVAIWLLALVVKWLIRVFLDRNPRYFTCWWVCLLASSVLYGIRNLLRHPYREAGGSGASGDIRT
jgi:hypothetical protein